MVSGEQSVENQRVAVQADGLGRSFVGKNGETRWALADVAVSLRQGQVHGLLGPNGAGKTTLCRIACTVLTPTSGSVAILGRDVVADAAEVRTLIGVVFGGDRGLYGRLTPVENLEFWCAMHGLGRKAGRARSAELLETLGLADRRDDRVETFSRGMKQRLHLARGLVGDPEVLLLDEPTMGMDPSSALEFRGLVNDMRAAGKTVLLTTHDMAEAESVCDTVTFIDRGTIVGEGTVAEVKARTQGLQRLVISHVGADDESTLRQLFADVSGEFDVAAGEFTVMVDVDGPTAQDLAMRAVQQGFLFVSTPPPSLESVYLSVLGQADGARRGFTV